MPILPKFDAELLAKDMALRGWVQRDIARVAEVPDYTVSKFLSGRNQSARIAKKLAEALGYTTRRYLLTVSRRKVA